MSFVFSIDISHVAEVIILGTNTTKFNGVPSQYQIEVTRDTSFFIFFSLF
jgi:hypothetical protein